MATELNVVPDVCTSPFAGSARLPQSTAAKSHIRKSKQSLQIALDLPVQVGSSSDQRPVPRHVLVVSPARL